MDELIEDLRNEFQRYKLLIEKALAQVPDESLNRVVAPGCNSIAMIVRHLNGNLTSRLSEFLTTDGEKVWRDRDTEFLERSYARDELEELWRKAWLVVDQTLGSLTDADMQKKVTIRQEEWPVHGALCRLSAHLSYHAGQIVLLSRMFCEKDWHWLSVPKGKSKEYMSRPAQDRKPKA
jgi:hypothetical protein